MFIDIYCLTFDADNSTAQKRVLGEEGNIGMAATAPIADVAHLNRPE